MIKILISTVFICFSIASNAQTSREALERQRQQLRNEIEQTEKKLNSNKLKTKENLLQWKLINNKVNLQDRVIDVAFFEIHQVQWTVITGER